MFLIKLNGEAAAVTNTFDSAACYAEGIMRPGRRITIVEMQPDDWDDAIRALERCQGVRVGAPDASLWAT